MSLFDDLMAQYGNKRHGSAGLLWTSPTSSRSLTDGRSGAGFNEGDPRYFQQDYDVAAGDGGSFAWKPTDHYTQSMGNKVQVRDGSRLIDPNAVDYSDEFGIRTDASNYKSDEDWLDKAFPIAAMAGFAGPALLHGLSGAGMGLGEAGGSGIDLAGSGPGWAAEGGAALSPETAGMMGGANYSGAGMIAPGMNSAAVADSFLINAGLPQLAGGTLTGLLSGSPFAHLAGSGLGGLLSTALSGAGLLSTASGLLGGKNNSGSPGGSDGPFAPLPKGKREPWTPNPFTAAQIQNFKYTGGR